MNKGLIKNFLPDYCFPNLLSINDELFLDSGLIIFDIDNTLVFPESFETKGEIVEWFNKIKSRHSCICVSNSRNLEKRKEKISELLGCEMFEGKKRKPSKKLFKEIEEKYGIVKNKIVVVGDRIFPDVLFGNSNGALTILVGPLSYKESFPIKIVRKIENFIIYFLRLFIR